MLKVRILSIGEAEDHMGRKYTRYAPCPMCEGSGNQSTWVSLNDFAKLLHQSLCTHEYTSYQSGMHFSAGDVWVTSRKYAMTAVHPLINTKSIHTVYLSASLLVGRHSFFIY
jgi:hypothetical protein